MAETHENGVIDFAQAASALRAKHDMGTAHIEPPQDGAAPRPDALEKPVDATDTTSQTQPTPEDSSSAAEVQQAMNWLGKYHETGNLAFYDAAMERLNRQLGPDGAQSAFAQTQRTHMDSKKLDRSGV